MRNNLYLKNSISQKELNASSLINSSKKFEKIFLEIKSDVSKENKTLNVLSRKFSFNFKIKDLKKFNKYKKIAIIGMGGSILGTEAIYNFFNDKIKKKFFFFNNLNSKEVAYFKKKEKIQKILFIVVSKSGNTIETLSNTFALNLVKTNSKNIIIISEKKNNLLYKLSKKYNLFYIEHKQTVGGRYSVLSEVGIIPSYLMGININKLRCNLLDYLKGTKKEYLKESSIFLSTILKTKKKNNLIFINYFPELEKFLYWCQQLIAESLGKKNKGFLPIISSAPKDHHSLLQLYLDGPKDKIFYIFSETNHSKNKINNKKFFFNKKNFNENSLDFIKNVQKKALIKALKTNNILFREIEIKKRKEETLGSLFSYFILETVIVAKLNQLNPFNQPAVEQVKIFTEELLNK